LVLLGADHYFAIDEEYDRPFGKGSLDHVGQPGFTDSMQVERVSAGFQIWENKVENHNVAEQNTTNVVSVSADDTIVPGNGSEVAVYQPRIASLPISSNANSQRRVSSPTLITSPLLPPASIVPTPTTAATSLLLHHESCFKKRSPVSLVADKYMILDELEGSSLNMCINIHTKEDYVCKVSRFCFK
jgi:hypothetical protein